jgi:hypothetical protein
MCVIGALGSVLACGGDTTAPALTPAQAYWALQLDQHAVTLALTAPYDTIQLTAVPLNALGQPLTGLGPAHYSTSDSLITVDSTGLVTAKFVTSGTSTTVVASMTDPVQHVTLADTCFIQVTVTAPSAPLATFAIQVPKGTVMPADQTFAISTTATDAMGNPIDAVPYFTSSDPSIAQVEPILRRILGGRTGQVTLYATTWAYGVAKRDSLVFSVVAPANVTINILPFTPTGSTHPILTFWPQTVTVAPGAKVTWANPSFTDSMDVVFDDPTHVDSVAINAALGFGTGMGDITPWVQDTAGEGPISAALCIARGQIPANAGGSAPPNCNLSFYKPASQRQRTFPVAGTYHYHSAKWGTSGTIVVQ